MRVVITGAAGFLGRRLVRRLLDEGRLGRGGRPPEAITSVLAVDVVPSAGFEADPRVQLAVGDISDPAVIERMAHGADAIFHLAAVVSVTAEEDFDLGMRVNLASLECLLEACRGTGRCPTLGFASSAAVYGGDLPAVIQDNTALTPQTSYGTQKAISEFLINDYSRRGFIEGFALRLPTIAVRPGKPNKAASTFASSIIREPLQGHTATCPVGPETSVCILSPRRVVDAFVRGAQLPGAVWGPSRVAQLPGLTTTVGDMLDSLRQIGGLAVSRRVQFQPDAAIAKIVAGLPTRFAAGKSRRLGFEADGDVNAIIHAFIEDELGGHIAPAEPASPLRAPAAAAFMPQS